MCCAEFIVKYILFFANLAFTLGGIALIALGVVVLLQIESLLDLIPPSVSLNVVPVTIIVLGSIIFLIAFFGCCGAIKESRCLLITYAVFMSILAAVKITVVVLMYQSLNNIQETVAVWINDAFNANNNNAFAVLEQSFRCCGTTGSNSYPGTVPPRCCANPINNTCVYAETYDGCIDVVTGYFDSFGTAIGGVIITVIIVELVAVVFSSFLSWSVGRKRNTY